MKVEAARRREHGLGGRPVRGWGGAACVGLIERNCDAMACESLLLAARPLRETAGPQRLQ